MHAVHRRRFLERLAQEGACAVIPAGRAMVRNHDCEFRFRPTSDFWYLTGFDEPESVLVLTTNGGACATLFVRPKDPEAEVWHGRRLGVERATEELSVDVALPLDELWEELPRLLAGHRAIVYRQGDDAERDEHMLESQRVACRRRSREAAEAPLLLVDPALWLHEERLIKSAAELDTMRKAAAITTEAHRLVMAEAAPGRNECELDALLDYTFRRRGGTGAAYANIVAGGANACILHYTENNMPLVDGELLLIDAGCEWNYYASDVTRTFPINGRFSAEQRALYDVVLDAQKAAVAAVRPGVSFSEPHVIATQRLVEGLAGLGLLQGDVEEILEQGSHAPLTIHRTSHWLGLDVHDCGSYFESDGSPRLLREGMVLTIEPGLYVAPENTEVDARWRGIGIRIEDDVLVTATGHENLTALVPKEVEDIEACCRGGDLAPAL